MDRSPLFITSADAATVRPLRHAVLRPHQTLADCVYPGDDEPESFHLVARDGQLVVGVASVYRQSEDGSSDGDSWRLRGMATDPAYRGRGIGRRVLTECLRRVRAAGGAELWCNARTTAAGFYEGLGFQARGPDFELPGIGPHRVLFHDLAVGE